MLTEEYIGETQLLCVLINDSICCFVASDHVWIVRLDVRSVYSVHGDWTLLLKLIVTQGVKKLPVFHKTVLFIHRVCREMKPIFSQYNSIKKNSQSI